MHNPTVALSINLVVTSNGVDQLQVGALLEKKQLKLTKQENNRMVQKMMEKEAATLWIGSLDPAEGSIDMEILEVYNLCLQGKQKQRNIKAKRKSPRRRKKERRIH